MKLTKHFTYDEMSKTSTGLPNHITIEARINLVYLCRKLESVRSQFGKPLVINSGFRSFAVNKEVGGVSNSLHLCGRACDISVANLSSNDISLLMSLLDDTNPTELYINLDKHYIHYAI